jgi:branched-subunit amino acid transport protein
VDQNTITLTIVGMAVVTYLPRLLPLLILTRKSTRGRQDLCHSERSAAESKNLDKTPSTLSPLVEAWLRYVPAAVLAAMLLPSLLVAEGRANLAWDNLYLWAALPTLGVAWKTRSLFAAVLTGMALVTLGRLWMG